MSYFKYQDYNVYYEIHGQGETLVILNGIMMSTRSWTMFIQELSKHNQLILIDLLDQGQSSKLDNLEYTQDIQVEMLKAFFDEIAIKNINLFGISYGASVALQFAVKHQEYLDKLLIFNGVAYTTPWLKEIGVAWNKATYDALAYYTTTIPVIYSPQFFNNNQSIMLRRKELLLQVFNNKEFTNAMIRLTNSSYSHDTRESLGLITIPTLIVGSEHDYITPIFEQRYLAEHIKNANFVILPDAGHASMYEKPILFLSLVLGFIHIEHRQYSL